MRPEWLQSRSTESVKQICSQVYNSTYSAPTSARSSTEMEERLTSVEGKLLADICLFLGNRFSLGSPEWLQSSHLSAGITNASYHSPLKGRVFPK